MLLHKIKELYIDDDKSTIAFTCHNVILADSLKKRVPEFFNFMKVEEQIQWEKRLWVMRSWGSYGNPNSGVYSYICNHYNIPFSRFSYGNTFDSICNDNFELASKLQLLIREKYNWKVNIGYETKEKVEGTLFISNRNNVKGLEFPFVICIMQDALTYDYSIRNSIYMMLTRSFLTSYLILPDTAKNINLLEEGIGFVNRKGFLKVEEPSDDEKRNLANAIINRGNLHKSLFQKAEEIMDEMGVVDKEHRDMIHQLIRVRFKNKENDENKLRKFIQANSGALE